jgi:hypothetical protein
LTAGAAALVRATPARARKEEEKRMLMDFLIESLFDESIDKSV